MPDMPSDHAIPSLPPALHLEDADPNLDDGIAKAFEESNSLWDMEADRLLYPDLIPEGVVRQVADGAPRPKDRRKDAWLRPNAKGLLGELRRKADSIRAQQARTQQETARVALELARNLYQVFTYLHDMVRQLNVIQPCIPRRYCLLDRYFLENLSWRHGFVDHYSLPQRVEDTAVSVSMAYRLVGETPVSFERDGSVFERFRKELFDARMEVEIEETRLDSYFVERVRFVVQPEIKVSMFWQIDPEAGGIRVRTQNLESRLGVREHLIAPETVTSELLDKLGSLILGHPKIHTWP
ncbi:MAG: hypothetical protein LBB51_00700 [Zoogloeaceae bacterium]|jgi:hypothetical protein|nr:hypothetical protein [Zoogloeaceae bacterium]